MKKYSKTKLFFFRIDPVVEGLTSQCEPPPLSWSMMLPIKLMLTSFICIQLVTTTDWLIEELKLPRRQNRTEDCVTGIVSLTCYIKAKTKRTFFNLVILIIYSINFSSLTNILADNFKMSLAESSWYKYICLLQTVSVVVLIVCWFQYKVTSNDLISLLCLTLEMQQE